MIVSFLTVTPGNLGVREWALGLVSYSTGYDFRNGVFAGTLDRAMLMTCTFLLGGFSILYIWHKTRRAKEKQAVDASGSSLSLPEKDIGSDPI
jgi:uncharacterized membrane protein YbhN (UPF0104 family)